MFFTVFDRSASLSLFNGLCSVDKWFLFCTSLVYVLCITESRILRSTSSVLLTADSCFLHCMFCVLLIAAPFVASMVLFY